METIDIATYYFRYGGIADVTPSEMKTIVEGLDNAVGFLYRRQDGDIGPAGFILGSFVEGDMVGDANFDVYIKPEEETGTGTGTTQEAQTPSPATIETLESGEHVLTFDPPVTLTALQVGWGGVNLEVFKINDGAVETGYTEGTPVDFVDMALDNVVVSKINIKATDTIFIDGYGPIALPEDGSNRAIAETIYAVRTAEDSITVPKTPAADLINADDYVFNRIQDVNLSVWTYPHWYDTDKQDYAIDFDLDRDLPAEVDQAYFEFLHLYKPTETNDYVEEFDADGNKVGVMVVVAGNNFLGTKIKGAYTPEYAQQVRNKISRPFCTLSGIGEHANHLTSQGTEYMERTATFCADFVRNVIQFKGIVVNVERLGNRSISQETATGFVLFLEMLTQKCHERGLEIIFTTQTHLRYELKEDQSGWEPVDDGLGVLYFENSMIYHIPFDYVNYMVIDLFWNQPIKGIGHFPYKAIKHFIDRTKTEDPLFDERSIIQLSNYAVWGYRDGWYNDDGSIAKTLEEQIEYYNRGWPSGLDAERWGTYMLLTRPQYNALLAGDEKGASLYLYDGAGADDIGWDTSAGYSLENGTRNPEDDTVRLGLGDGVVNRFITVKRRGLEAIKEPTFVNVCDEVTLDNKMKYVFDNYGIKRFSLWHAHKNTVFWTQDAIQHLGGTTTTTTPKKDGYLKKLLNNTMNYVGELFVGALFTKVVLGL